MIVSLTSAAGPTINIITNNNRRCHSTLEISKYCYQTRAYKRFTTGREKFQVSKKRSKIKKCKLTKGV